MTADRDQHHARGVSMMIVAALLFSCTGPCIRLMQGADAWQIQFWRSVAMVAVVLAFVAWRWRGDLAAAFGQVPPLGWTLGVLMGGSFVCYLLAMTMTTIANVVFMLAAVPFIAALLAWALFREQVRRSTLVAMVVALVGVGLMIGDGLGTGQLAGTLVAFAAVALHALYLVTARRYPQVDFTPMNAVAGAVAGAIGAAVAPSLLISGHDMALSLVLGAITVGIPFILVVLATRHMTAAEVALIGILESVVAPVWVWLLVGEAPGLLAVAGGAVVLGAVIFQSAAAARYVRGG